MTLANMGHLSHKGYWILVPGTCWGAGIVLFSTCTTYRYALLCMGLVGFISAINMAMNRSIAQLQVSQRMRGQIMSIDMMSHGLMPLGMIPVGWIADHVSIQAGLTTSGTILATLTLLLGCFLPKVRAIDTGFLVKTA